MTSENRIGVYRIVRLIRRGGQGSVYLGYDTLLERRVAIKIYDLPAQRSARKQLVSEAQVVASLDSPKIVPVHDVIESDAHLAMVMAYVPGCSLEDFLCNHRPSLDSIVTVGTDVAGALAIARQERVVHSDVKPANVLLTQDGHARLTDFGIARELRSTVAAVPLGGSFWSLTPEHLRGEEITQQADIYALGVLLYRMLCLQHPFAEGSNLDTDRMLSGSPIPLQGRVPPEFEVPAILGDYINTMLDADPRRRPNNTRGVRQVLRDVSRGIPMSVGSVLLRESRPFFRAESPEDIPLQIPRELARSGRSRKTAPEGASEKMAYWFTGLRAGTRRSLLVTVLVAVLSALVYVVDARPTVVAFSEPITVIESTRHFPGALSPEWLVEALREVIQEQLGEIVVAGEVGVPEPLALYSASAAPKAPSSPSERYAITMRCASAVCLVTLSRSVHGARRSEQAMVFEDAPLQDWREAIRNAAQGLFR